MGTAPFNASTKVPIPEALMATETNAQLPNQRLSLAARLRRLEEAKAFLRQQLAAGPQPARAILKAAKAAGIATRTLHRAKDALGVMPARSGGYGAHGKWTWYPPGAAVLKVFPLERPMAMRRS